MNLKPTGLWSLFDRVMTDIRDYHMPAFLIIFFTGGVLSWFKHLDGTFVAFSTAVLTAITGHAVFSPTQKLPDAPSAPQTDASADSAKG